MTKRVMCLLMCLVLIKGVSLVSAQTPPVVQSKSLSTTTCTSSASAGCLIVATNDLGGSGIQITGTWVGTISFYWTNEDNATGTYLDLTMIPNGSSVGVTSTTGNGGWTADVSGYRYVKIAFSAYTSGTAVVTLVRSHARSGGGGSSGPVAGGSPAGSDTQVQFNDVGAFGGDAGFVYNKTTDTPTATGPYLTGNISTTVPGFSFVGDTDTGFGADSADRLVFITGGARKWLLSSTALFPLATNAVDLGASGNTVQNVFVGTALQTGTSPATVGVIRLSYGSGVYQRTQTAGGAANVLLFGMGNVLDDDYIEYGSNSQTSSKPLGVKIYPGSTKPLRYDTDGTARIYGTADGVSSATYYLKLLSSGTDDGSAQVRMQRDDGLGATKLRLIAEKALSLEPSGSYAGAFISDAGPTLGAKEFQLRSDVPLTWSSGSADQVTTADTGLKRNAANRLEVTNGGSGVGSVMAGYIATGATPSVANVGANSCGTSAATIAGNNNAGAVTVGATSGTQCRITTTITAPNRWHCAASNETTAALARCVHVDTTHFDLVGVFVAGDVVSYVANPR